MKLIITLACSFLIFISDAQESYLLVGTYDSPKSEGIYVYKFNSSDGSAREISHVKTSNPSFLAISPNEKYVYAVNEIADSTGKGGRVSSFSFSKKTGTLSFLSRQSSEGNHPCYITMDQTGSWLIAGNYSSGNFSVLRSNKGLLSKSKKVVQHTGAGPDTTRQKSPHVHGIFFSFDKSRIYVTDLGIDKIMSYHFDSKSGRIFAGNFPFFRASPGSGPRHLAIHPNGKYIYVAQELAGSVAVLKNTSKDSLQEVQNISALPLTYRGKQDAADIHVSPDGLFLYCSVRANANSIAIYKIDEATGLLTIAGHQQTLGEGPRNFNFDPTGKFLLVGNQRSDEIVIFKRNAETGLLTDTGKRISVGKPVCIKWIKTE